MTGISTFAGPIGPRPLPPRPRAAAAPETSKPNRTGGCDAAAALTTSTDITP